MLLLPCTLSWLLALALIPSGAENQGAARVGPQGLPVDLDGDGIEDALEDVLMVRFAPELRLYPDTGWLWVDRFRLASASRFFASMELQFNQGLRCEHDTLLGAGQVNSASLLQQLAQQRQGLFCSPQGPQTSSGLGPSSTPFYLAFDESSYEGDLSSAEIYAHIHFSSVPGAIYDVQYWFYYPYNGDLFLNFGHHEGDWEHVTVRVAADQRSVHSVYYAAHADEGQVYRPGHPRLTLLGGQRPVVYSAWNSHASFPDARIQWRPFPLPPDLTANTGPVVDVAAIVVNMGEKDAPLNGCDWLQFSGDWGRPNRFPFNLVSGGGPTGPAYKSSWLSATQE